jgi:hypothetical protein
MHYAAVQLLDGGARNAGKAGAVTGSVPCAHDTFFILKCHFKFRQQ